MITVNSFISDTLNMVDVVIGNFVSASYANFVQANSGLITLLFTVYVMVLGFQFLNHNHHFNLSAVTRHIIVMLCVYGMVMNWHLYHLFVYNIFTNEPGNVAQVLVTSAGKFHFYGGIDQVLDEIYWDVIKATISCFGNVNFTPTGLEFIFYGILVFVIGSLMCIFSLLLFIYAKMMMAVVLSLGPIFILFILWEPTKGMFAAWLRTLITIALIPIVTSAILMLMLSVINVTLIHFHDSENLQFYGIAPFLGLSVVTTLILSQVFRISSSLGGGITMSSLSVGAAIVISTLNKSGVNLRGRTATDRLQKRANKNRRVHNHA